MGVLDRSGLGFSPVWAPTIASGDKWDKAPQTNTHFFSTDYWHYSDNFLQLYVTSGCSQMAKIKSAGSCSGYLKAKVKQGGTEASLTYFRS